MIVDGRYRVDGGENERWVMGPRGRFRVGLVNGNDENWTWRCGRRTSIVNGTGTCGADDGDNDGCGTSKGKDDVVESGINVGFRLRADANG